MPLLQNKDTVKLGNKPGQTLIYSWDSHSKFYPRLMQVHMEYVPAGIAVLYFMILY